ncbi:hypothetical protein [Wenjunlia tyrosinilytica]|uniref:Uncharacterized protein n=1 Tax=Wenjunlia tyrosinilytica TaxID=1544741 RepID=A0A917ZXC2_9ACTN|nr:hypothetical protein [Wenjunlia tyrosinilytica]GGO98739.1 hypothetical protein GCM10012280_63580 [Wenjunlia tyrosinilytica]
MADVIQRVTGPVFAQYHQFLIREDDQVVGPHLPVHSNGLVEIEDDRATVDTGVHTADVEVTLSLHRGEPAPDLRHWQEVVEVSLHSTTGELQLRAMGVDLECDFPLLSFAGPGDYRIRVHARGRDTAVDGAPEEIVEWYLIQAWPAPAAPATVLAADDDYGEEWRATIPGPHETIMGTTTRMPYDDPAGIREREARLRNSGNDD